MQSELEKLIVGFSEKYKAKARLFAAQVQQLIKQDVAIEAAIEIADKEYAVSAGLKKTIQRLLLDSAALGAGTTVAAIQTPAVIKALEDAWNPDGMKLSARLHGAERDIRTKIIDAIKAQQKLNASCMQAARALYDGYGYGHVTKRQDLPQYLDRIVTFARQSELSLDSKARLLGDIRATRRIVDRLSQGGAPNQALKTAYKNLLDKAESLNQKALDNAIRVAIEEKSRYIAERIARTEAARAWADGFYAKYHEKKNVVAYQWKKGTRHPVFDICDMYAEADLFGLGKGVYPKDQVPPLPAHPHCLCRLLPVFDLELELEGKTMREQISAGGRKYLDALPELDQRRLLTSRGYEIYKDGGDWQPFLQGWRGLENPKSRLKGLINGVENNI